MVFLGWVFVWLRVIYGPIGHAKHVENCFHSIILPPYDIYRKLTEVRQRFDKNGWCYRPRPTPDMAVFGCGFAWVRVIYDPIRDATCVDIYYHSILLPPYDVYHLIEWDKTMFGRKWLTLYAKIYSCHGIFGVSFVWSRVIYGPNGHAPHVENCYHNIILPPHDIYMTLGEARQCFDENGWC